MCIVKFHILYWLLEKDSHFHTPYLCIHVPLTFTACCGAHDHYFIRLLVFATTPGLKRGMSVKGQGLYPLCYFHWRVHGVFGIFNLWLLKHNLQVPQRHTHSNVCFTYLVSRPHPGMGGDITCMSNPYHEIAKLSFPHPWKSTGK